MDMQNNQKKIGSMLLILLSLFIFVFFTKDYYSQLIITLDAHESSLRDYNDTKEELDTLSKKSKELQKSGDEGGKEATKYLNGLHEDEIITKFYKYAENNSKNGTLTITELNLSEGIKNELGFNEATINISLEAQNLVVLQDFLDFIVENQDYKFFITNFSLPPKFHSKTIIQIPITYFYKQL